MDQIVTEIVRAAPFMAVTMAVTVFLTTMIWVRELDRNNKEWSDFCTKLNKSWAESCNILVDLLREAENSQNVT